MIERQFVSQKIKEYQIQEFIGSQLGKTGGYSHTEIKRTPLGEKIIIYTSRPGLVVGRKGENINRLTEVLKRRFKMENPQIEIGELENPGLDVQFVADKIASTLERFGSKRFKSIGYKNLQSIIDAGALGAEIVLSGKIPSARARSWRFSAGYLKKSGDIAENKIKKALAVASLKSGIIGIKVSIMTPDIELPDKLKSAQKEVVVVEEIKEEQKETEEKKVEEKIEETEKIEEPKTEEQNNTEEKKVKRTKKSKETPKESKDGNNKKE